MSGGKAVSVGSIDLSEIRNVHSHTRSRFLKGKMCLDCAFGSCNGNTTECVCQPPYTQTREMFVFPPGFVCLEANIEACLPCDINGDAVVVLFVLGAVSSFLALVLLTYRLASFRRIQRNAMMYCGFIG